MATIFAKVALAALLIVISAVALVGLSGMIVFSDLNAPQPQSIAAEALSKAPAVSGVNK